MAELKTKKTESSVTAFLESIDDEQKKTASYVILDLMKEVTGAEPKMWGESIVGFGEYRYKYASGQEGDWLLTGFSPRKNSLTLYLSYGFEGLTDLMSQLGKYKTGKACLYIKRLEDINLTVLKELVQKSVAQMKTSS